MADTSGFPSHRIRISKMCWRVSTQFPSPCPTLWNLLWCFPGRVEPLWALCQQDGHCNEPCCPFMGHLLCAGPPPMRASWAPFHRNFFTQRGESHPADLFCLTTNLLALETFLCTCHCLTWAGKVYVSGSLPHRLRWQEDNEALVSKSDFLDPLAKC